MRRLTRKIWPFLQRLRGQDGRIKGDLAARPQRENGGTCSAASNDALRPCTRRFFRGGFVTTMNWRLRIVLRKRWR